MTVKNPGTPDDTDIYYLSEAAIPDIFTTFAYQSFLKSSHDRVILEFIDSDGAVIPCLVSKIPLNNSDEIPKNTDYILKTETLNSSPITELIFFDIDRRIIKIISYQDQAYTITRTSAETLIKLFPGQSELIKMNKTKSAN